MFRLKVTFLSVLFTLTAFLCYGQKSVRDSCIAFWTLGIHYEGAWPGGTMAERYGYTNLFNIEFGKKFKNNVYFTVGAGFMFGETVKETNMFSNLAFNQTWKLLDGTNYSVFGWIDGDGNVFYPNFEQRGYVVPIRVGYIINKLRLPKQNPNCGPFVEIGLQFMEHSIYFKGIPARTPYMSGDMLKGYDRLSNGFGALQSIGYKFFGNKRYINAYVAFDISENFTQNRRTVNYDTGLADNRVRSDILYGFRIGWCYPLYRVAPEKYYYY